VKELGKDGLEEIKDEYQQEMLDRIFSQKEEKV
jgi:hypothetical protein